ncbi:MAG: HD domain-containing protein [Candidatus Thorarchaeota archaeon SMTZ1-45]|nr:MAG: hypothetical protein AM325_06665 [Candidatus Thorarchaeota archaeon SMTZ1-45]
MNINQEIISLAKNAEILKGLGRNGWALAGVHCTRQESVGEHSFGAVLVSLLIAKSLADNGERVNLERVAFMATMHDFPEVIISDIPRASVELGGEQLKEGKVKAEQKAIHQLSKSSEFFGDFIVEIWSDLMESGSIEARIVLGADIIDMLIHTLALEKSGVSPKILDQFFKNSIDSLRELKLEIIENTFWEIYREHIDNAKRMGIELDQIIRD